MHRLRLLPLSGSRWGLLVAVLLAFLQAGPAFAAGPVSWKARIEPASPRAGEAALLVLEATVEEPWHIYSTTPRTGMGPLPTKLELAPGKALTAEGKPLQPPPHKVLDPGFKIEVEEYPGAVAFGLPVRINPGVSGPQKAVVKAQFMACKEGNCTPPLREELAISFTVAAGPARAEHSKTVTTPPAQPSGYVPPPDGGKAAGTTSTGAPGTGTPGAVAEDLGTQIQDTRSRGLLPFLGLALTMGFLALLTPCVFPMVPITVSFFAKQQEVSPGSGLRGAVAYCLGIILTFTGLGLVMSLAFGAGSISKFATNPVVNVALALLFTVMAVNLFGGFQIMLPSWMVERSQAGTQRGGLAGPMLMGLTFTLTSFTCTFAFVGTLLAATTQGDVLWPALGMLAFSAAFASPFFLLALFPQWLSRLPRSGSWLVTVKAFMGFLELAAALKFLSNADLVWEWGLLTRPVFLAVWFAIFVIAGCYLLGWLQLPHDDAASIGWGRKAVGVLTVVSGVWMLGAINGNSLGQVNGFLPPRVYPGTEAVAGAGELTWIESYDEALRQAKEQNKPLFIDFTGVTCTNCRVIEDTVFTRPEVVAELGKFVRARLYTDKDDPESRRYAELQLQRFKQNTLPLYVIQTGDETKLGERSYDPPTPQSFVQFMQRAQQQFAEQAGVRTAQAAP